MKSLIFIFLSVCIIAFAGCDLVQTSVKTSYTIKVFGNDGLAFAGNFGGITPEGGTVTQSVEGVLPVEYIVKGTRDTIIFCSFVKRSEIGTLNVQIFKGGQLLAQSGTTDPFGSVTLATSPSR